METKKIYLSAFYIRLSREDGDKEESDSIRNQRKLLMEFIDSKADLKLYQTYADEGYSGTNLFGVR